MEKVVITKNNLRNILQSTLIKNAPTEGVPGWLSLVSIWLLISASVSISSTWFKPHAGHGAYFKRERKNKKKKEERKAPTTIINKLFWPNENWMTTKTVKPKKDLF